MKGKLLIASLSAVLALVSLILIHPVAAASAATNQLNGTGSSFAAPAIENWENSVRAAPYNLNVNYTSSSSGQGRLEFTNGTTDFAASDIAYGLGSTDTQAPSFPFAYIPIVAGGIGFMYNLPGLSKTLQLSSYTACAVLTSGIKTWNDPAIAKDNPGVSLPNLAIRPVTESDSAGTNFAMEEWCIAEQPALWAAFANQENHQAGGPSDGVAIDPNAPESNWPGLPNGLDQVTTSGVAGSIATTPGALGAVQVKYATDLGFGPATPAKGVAAVLNASGKYTEPTAVNIASALAYATQLDNGTQLFNFNGVGPNVYNPSTYSYLLVRTMGGDPAKGAVLSAFINYALTLGQQSAPTFGYASLGLSLDQYGIKVAMADVPGSVPTTADEQKGFACGDLTPTEVAAGQTTPTCGVVQGTAPPPGSTGGTATATSASVVSLISSAPAGPFSSGQSVEVAVNSNSNLTPGLGVYIEECTAPGGVTPTIPTQCDVKSHQHNPTFANGDGSLDYKGYPIYALPDAPNLGETSGGGPACDLSDQCVLYVGQNPNDFSKPHVWSSAFFVRPNSNDSGVNPGNGLPEVPVTISLPILAVAIIGGAALVRRRRQVKVRAVPK